VNRLAGWAAAGVVAVVVAAALVDALRGGDGAEPAPSQPAPAPGPEAAAPRSLAARLREARVGGRLLFTDERCRLRVVALPDLTRVGRGQPEGLACSFTVAGDGRRIGTAGAVWSADGRRVARCRGRTVEIFVGVERGPPADRRAGCKPAWRPDGGLTLVRSGRVLVVPRGCRRPACEVVVLDRADVRRAAARHPTVPDVPGLLAAVSVVDMAWLGSARLVLLLDLRLRGRLERLGPLRLVAVFLDGRIVATRPDLGRRFLGVEASPLGTMVAVEPGLVLRHDGLAVPLPDGYGRVRALAFSPDERWIAAAARGAVVLFRRRALEPRDGGRREPGAVSLPFVARDLHWR
jgi:hypothetical protein